MPIPVKLCPHCRQRSCYHCWECGARIDCEDHKEGCTHQTRPFVNLDTCKVVCPACNDTGRNSKGKPCFPCTECGRVKPKPVPKFKGVEFDL